MTGFEVVNFGCRLNAYEAETIKAMGEAEGLANTLVFNTCAVTAEAQRQARQAIRRARRAHPTAIIIVTGCAAQIDPQSFARLEAVDLVIGNAEKSSAATWRKLKRGLLDEEKILVNDIMSVKETALHLIDGFGERARAFVQIQNGCDHRCTFCIIPFGRGPSRSVAAGLIVEQIRRLVENGVGEVVLTGVDVTSWGADLPGRPRLGDLVRRICKLVPELPRLRLSSLDSIEVDRQPQDGHCRGAAAHAASPFVAAGRRRPDPQADEAAAPPADAIAFCATLQAAAPRYCLRRRSDRRLSDRERRSFREFHEARRRVRAELPPCLSLFGAAGHAGGADAAGAATLDPGTGGTPSGGRGGGIARLSCRRDRSPPRGAGREPGLRAHRACRRSAARRPCAAPRSRH